MGRPKLNSICTVEGCGHPHQARGFCKHHYYKGYYAGDFKFSEQKKRRHKFYSLWFERKTAGILCEEWLDFWKFVAGIGEKPGKNFLLIRLRDEPFSPDNFEWREHLSRQEGESNKAWWARKWAARQAANPGLERARSLKRFYGLTPEQFSCMEAEQNDKCAICKEPETSIDGKSGTVKRLAVDHCHTTNKVRGLLCWRCNAAIGKFKDSPTLLQSAIDYLNKHKDI